MDENLRNEKKRRRKITKRIVKNVKRLKLHENTNEICCICLIDMYREDHAIKLKCNHLFHNSCVFTWLLKNDTCPTCRHEFTKDKN